MLKVMYEPNREEHLSQPLQTNDKQFKVANAFLTGYNGILKVTISNNKFYFTKPITDKDGLFFKLLFHKVARKLKG